MTIEPSAAPARTINALLDSGASPAAVVALVRLRDVHRRLELLEDELDRHALEPLTDARYRELMYTTATLDDAAGRLTSVRRRLEEVK